MSGAPTLYALSRQQLRAGGLTRIRLRAPGGLDEARLRAALDAVVARHEALRTRIVTLSGAPVQEVGDAGQVSLRVHHDTVELELPAVCADRRSALIVADELAALYAGASLPSPATQYPDYCGWQAEVATEAPAPAGALPVLVRPGPLATRRRVIPARPAGEVAAAWATVLARLCGGQPFVLGVGDDGRSVAPGLETAVGSFERLRPVVVTDPSVLAAEPGEVWHAGGEPVLQWVWTDPRATWVVESVERPRGDVLLALDAGPGWLELTAPVAWVDVLLDEVAGTAAAPPAPPVPARPLPSVARSFRRWVAETPDAPAVRAAGRAYTYADLGAAAARVTRGLRARGAGPGTVVAVTGARGFDLVAALVGVIESGATLMPVDPSLPPLRRERMLRLGDARLTVDAAEVAGLDGPAAAPVPDDEDADAYLFFTSGSTGEPRGVVGGRWALAHFLAWQRSSFAVGPGDRVAFLTGLSFDVMLRDLLLPLTAGATLLVPGDEVRAAPADVLAWLAAERATVVHAVPSLASVWLDARVRLPELRLTFFAGEPLAMALVDRWRAAAPVTRVVNLYGPTETTLARCWHEVGPGETDPIPVGRPLPDCQALVVTGDGRAAAPGEPGEVVLRTAYRARRLLDGDFPDPHDYRTGDAGARRADGALVLLGRLDDQLKLNGVRVQPAEITAELLRHPAVRAAAVLVEDGRLTAAVVGPTDGLRGWLAERLPAALVPARLVSVERIPLNPSGKVDRAALAALVAPPAPLPLVTPRQHALAALYAELCGRAPAGRRTSLFDLGASSLTVMELVLRLRREGAALQPVDVFADPTIEGLAAHLDAAGPAPAPAPTVARLTGAPFRLWYESQRAGGDAYHLAWAVELRGALDPADLGRALDEVVAAHPALRSVFPVEDGVPLRRVLAAAPVPLPLAGERDLPALARAPFDLAAAPPLRAALVRRAAGEHLLFVVAHHILVDATGRQRFTAELLARLAAIRAGAPLPVVARDLPAATPAGDLGHWTAALAGARALPLPVDDAAPASLRELTLAGSTWDAIRDLAAARGTTPFAVVLAAFQASLAAWTGARDVVVGVPVANRGAPGAEDAIGCFINLVALRADVAGAPDLAALVAKTRAGVAAALAHQDVPFDAVVAAVAPARAGHPLFDVLFNWLGPSPRPPALPGLAVAFPEPVPPAARFAVTLYAREAEGTLALRLVVRAGTPGAGLLDSLVAILDGGGLPHVGSAPPRPSPAPPPAAAHQPLEAAVLAAWRDELGLPGVGRDDDFFALGGTSLGLLGLSARLRASLGVDLPLRAFHAAPTPAALAAWIAGHAPAPRPTRRSQAPSLGQRHLLARVRAEGSRAEYTIPRAVTLRGPLDETALRAALAAVIARHEGLAGSLPLAVHETAAVDDLVRDAWQTPFDAPLRLALARVARDEHVLIAVTHELAADCWSMGIAGAPRSWLPGIFFTDLAALYAERLGGPAAPAPTSWDLGTARVWQEDWLASDEAANARAFWRDTLAGLADQRLPADGVRGDRFDYRGARPAFTIPDALVVRLRGLARAHRATLFETLVAVLDAALFAWTGRRDLCVGTPVPGRPRPELLATFGPLGNLLALRAQVDPDAPFAELLARVRRSTRAALLHQELPFPLVAAPVVGDAPDAWRRLFAARLVLHRPEHEELRAGGVHFTPRRIARALAKHDLTLFLVETRAGLEGWFEHATALFSPATIAALAARFLAVAAAACDRPDAPLARVIA